MRRQATVAFGCIALVFAASLASAQKKGATEPISDDAVMAFVDEHHPELGRLLKRLKKDSSKEYARAIGETRAVADRVARMSERQPDRARNEIDLWKVNSQIRLLIARMVSLMAEPSEGGENPELDAVRLKLRELAAQRVKLDRDRLERDKKMLMDRLSKLQEQSESIDADFDAAVEKQMNALTRNLDVAARKRGVASKRPKSKENSAEIPAQKKNPGNKNSGESVQK